MRKKVVLKEPKNATDTLYNVLRLLKPKGGWIQRSYRNGKCGFCLEGALRQINREFVYNTYTQEARARMLNIIGLDYNRSLINFNDTAERKKKEVIAMVQKAIKTPLK